MARRKNAPESIRVKHGLSDRLRALRNEFYGERGGPDLARTLEIPVRTWYNYENGVTVPAEIILRIVELTSVEPVWLLRGEGPKFRVAAARPASSGTGSSPEGLGNSPITTLLRVALERLEQQEQNAAREPLSIPCFVPVYDRGLDPTSAATVLEQSGSGPYLPNAAVPGESMRLEPGESPQAYRRFRMLDDSMTPIVAEGAEVAYAEPEPISESLHEKLVVVVVDGTTLVRWFNHCGRFALLRAENPSANPPSILIDLDRPDPESRLHRVLWISTPH